MDLENLSQDWSKKIKTLKENKDVATIISKLNSADLSTPGFHVITPHFSALNISREGMDAFIGLLDTNEYLKGTGISGNGIGENMKEQKYDHYYTTLGNGIVLEFNFRETVLRGPGITGTLPAETALEIESYVDSRDLSISVKSRVNGTAQFMILDKNDMVVGFCTTSADNVRFNNQKLNDAITPISVEQVDFQKDYKSKKKWKNKYRANIGTFFGLEM